MKSQNLIDHVLKNATNYREVYTQDGTSYATDGCRAYYEWGIETPDSETGDYPVEGLEELIIKVRRHIICHVTVTLADLLAAVKRARLFVPEVRLSCNGYMRLATSENDMGQTETVIVDGWPPYPDHVKQVYQRDGEEFDDLPFDPVYLREAVEYCAVADRKKKDLPPVVMLDFFNCNYGVAVLVRVGDSRRAVILMEKGA